MAAPRDGSPHGVAEEVCSLDVEMVQESDNIVRHLVTAVGLRVIRLPALAVPAAIECDHLPHGTECVYPTCRDPVALEAAGEAVDKNDRLPFAEHLVMHWYAAGLVDHQ